MRSKPSRLALSGIALVCAALLSACNDSPRLQFLTVAPTSGEIYVSGGVAGGVRGAVRDGARPAMTTPRPGGRHSATLSAATGTCGSLQYAATALYSDGSTKDVSSTATWSSSNTSVATISATGLASGIGLGTTNIGATSNGVAATSEPLAVDQLNSITVSPSPATQPLGSTQQFAAAGNFTFASGGSSDLDVSSQVTWNSSNTNVATIDSTGNATTVGEGTTNITASSCDGLVSNTVVLTVTPAAATSLVVTPATITISTGTTTLFTAMEKLSNGTIRAVPPGTVVTWSSDAPTMATVDPNSGVALGVAVGGANITASAAGLTSGSGALTVQAAAARFAYIANSLGANNSGSISGYTVDVTGGTLKPLSGSPFSAFLPQQVMIHPSGDFMYYIDFGGALHVEDIDSSATPTGGSLSDSGQMAVPASSTQSANVGVIDPTGRFIYVISDAGNSIFGFSIAQTADKAKATNGALTGIPNMLGPAGYTDTTLNSPVAILTDRAGKYLYVVNNLGNSVSEYSIDQSTGALKQLGNPPTAPAVAATGAAPFFATTDVNGHLYVANSGDQTVSAFSIGSGGVLAQVGSNNFPVATATSTVFNVLTDPTGKYLYVLDSPATAGNVFAYNLGSSGAITTQIGTAQVTGQSPIGMAIDPTGALLAIDNNIDNTISLFMVTQTGTSAGGLTPATPPTVNTDTAPQFVVFYTAAPGQ